MRGARAGLGEVAGRAGAARVATVGRLLLGVLLFVGVLATPPPGAVQSRFGEWIDSFSPRETNVNDDKG
tara:strand:+ start:2002 stop:2208 length:207 start_codon:yes stop_codon:yes gene_type:complete